MSIVEKAMSKRRRDAQGTGKAGDGDAPASGLVSGDADTSLGAADDIDVPPAFGAAADEGGDAGTVHHRRGEPLSDGSDDDTRDDGAIRPGPLAAADGLQPPATEGGAGGTVSGPERAAQRLREGAEGEEAVPATGAAERAGEEAEAFGIGGFAPVEITIDPVPLRRAGLWPEEAHERRIRDQFRRIKRPLLANAFGINTAQLPHGNLIMVASSLPGEGKSFTSLNLARSIARELDRTILLVDSDVAKPHLTRALGADARPGLISVLMDPSLDLQDVILPTSLPGMRFLPAGPLNEHATELLSSERMASLVTELSERYADRIILFDTPPLIPTTEAQAMTHLMGQIVLVVHAAHTPQAAVLQALESIHGGAPVSCVLNKTRGAVGEEYGYGEYY